MDKEISQRIAIIRYLMVIGIVVLHVPPSKPISQLAQTPFGFLKAFFSHALFRATVPMLTVISGFLVFHSHHYLNFKRLIKKKILFYFSANDSLEHASCLSDFSISKIPSYQP